MKGNYEDIPNIYSNYLRNIIRIILCLGPVKYPSIDELLNSINKIGIAMIILKINS